MMPLNPKISRRVSNQHVGDAKILPAVLNLSDGMGPVEDIAPAPLKTTKAFTDSLVGLLVADAEQAVREQGFEPMVVQHGHMVAAVLMPGVLVLWLEAGDEIVGSVSGGDPAQVVENE